LIQFGVWLFVKFDGPNVNPSARAGEMH